VSQTLETIAPAKLNLTLRVIGRRADGFHLLDGITAFTAFGDRLRVQSVGTRDTISLSGPFAGNIDGENIVSIALKAYRSATTIPGALAIDVEKNIPVSAGLGGGSCDAAALLRILQTLAPVPLPNSELNEMAISLGADVPVCLASNSARMRGIGERLRNIGPLPPVPLVLINPGIGVSAGNVFREFAGPYAPAREPVVENWTEELLFDHIRRRGHNDLIAPAVSLAPEILDVLETLEARTDVRASGMSGSGATCFALFNSNGLDAAQAVAKAAVSNGWWATVSKLLP
jgi:4-diphosphocytidyl-2-C-methyl-D-erythritol kinase